MPARRVKGSCARVPRPLTRRTGDAAARGCLQHPKEGPTHAFFTIETTYRLPVYRHQTYEAATIDEACRLASTTTIGLPKNATTSSAGETYVTGIWSGENAAYSGAAQPIPSHYVETPQRIASHFEVLLGLVKVLASQSDTEQLDRTFWLERAQPAIAKPEALLAGGREPD